MDIHYAIVARSLEQDENGLNTIHGILDMVVLDYLPAYLNDVVFIIVGVCDIHDSGIRYDIKVDLTDPEGKVVAPILGRILNVPEIPVDRLGDVKIVEAIKDVLLPVAGVYAWVISANDKIIKTIRFCVEYDPS